MNLPTLGIWILTCLITYTIGNVQGHKEVIQKVVEYSEDSAAPLSTTRYVLEKLIGVLKQKFGMK